MKYKFFIHAKIYKPMEKRASLTGIGAFSKPDLSTGLNITIQ